MTKLKTLKDFEFEQITDVRPDGYEGNAPGRKRIIKRKCVFSYHLRQEAIRQIKELRNHKFYCLICEKFDCDCGSSDCFKPRSEYVENWIKHSSNITEEDLMTNEEINAREHGERGNN